VVTGAAGQTGRLVVGMLVAAGHDVLGVVRRAEQVEALTRAGAGSLLADLTQVAPSELRAAFAEADAVAWAAGAGYGVDPALVDGEACIHAQQAADEAGVARWVQISSMFADRPEDGPPFLRPVLSAKHRSDSAVAGSALGWTVVRPGGLTNDRPTGRVTVGTSLSGGLVPRGDVAAVVVACLDVASTARQAFDLVAGEVPVADALASLPGAE
jgi:uncharacterized protein YbjT (DUF2867 family)